MKSIFFLIFLSICTYSFSQKKVSITSEKKSLEKTLKTIEDIYEIKFSFNSSIIKDINVLIPKEIDTLNAILQTIQTQTSLVFSKINDRYYTIKKDANILICGYIVNKQKKPIIEAFIYNINRSQSSTSNKKGYFELRLPDSNDTISIQFLGYKTKKIVVKQFSKSDCKVITLTEEDFQLGEVLITEYITSGISKSGINGAININPSKLGILPKLVEPDVLQSLQFVPGIQSPTETAASLHIRGGTPDQNLVLWDGIKMYSTGHFFDLLSIFNPHITENIQLYRSSTEVKYGGRISGVVDIKSKNEIPEKFGFGFGFNMTNADIYIINPINKEFAFIFSARRAFTDFIETSTFRSYSDRAFQSIRFFVDNQELDQKGIESENTFFFNDVTAKIIYTPSNKDKFTISSIFTKNNLDYSLTIKNILGFSEPFNDLQKDELSFINQGMNISWDKEWNSHFSHTANVYFSNYNFNYIGLRESRASRDGFLFFRNNITEKNRIKDTGASIYTDLKINDTHKIITGYDFVTNKITYNAEYSANQLFTNESSNNITHAFFSEYRYDYNNKLKINAGIRGNYFSVLDKIFWEPRIHLETYIKKGITAKMAIERKNQVLSQVSNYLPNDFNIDNQVWLLADSEFVSPLSSNQVSAGFIINKNNWYIDIEGYYKATKGITSFANGFNGVLNLSTGKSTIQGLDLLIKKRIYDYRTWISYSITNQDFIFNTVNNGNSFSGNFDITHYASWIHSYQWNNFEFSLGWNIRTGRPYTPALGITQTGNTISINYDTVNSDRLNTYHRLDLSASYKFNLSKNEKWRSKIGFSLFNLYNRKNILNRTYNIKFDNNTSLLQEVNTFSSGITPNLSLRIDF